jgi:hypothetical protein
MIWYAFSRMLIGMMTGFARRLGHCPEPVMSL